jgi:cadmium resistance protein CadD (predicted permease)
LTSRQWRVIGRPMNNMIAIIPVAAAAYVATNLDNFILLVALLARYRNHTANVIGGFIASTLILVLVGMWIGKAANIVPVEYLGLLGFVPISIGVFELIQLRRSKSKVAETEVESVDGAQKVFMTTLSSQLGNGVDTVVVFGVLFIDSVAAADFLAIITFAAMAFIFVCVGIYAVRHPALRKRIDRHAHRVMPFILILVGAYVVANTATDLVPA